MRRRNGPFDPNFLQLLAHVAVGVVLSKTVPFLYGKKPAIMQIGSTTPYSSIYAAVKRDAAAVAVALLAALVALAAKLLKFW